MKFVNFDHTSISFFYFSETKPALYNASSAFKPPVDAVHRAGTNVSNNNTLPACSNGNSVVNDKNTTSISGCNQKNLSISSKLSSNSTTNHNQNNYNNNTDSSHNDHNRQSNNNQEENLLLLSDTHKINHNHSSSSSIPRLSDGWFKLMHSCASNQASVIQSCPSNSMVTQRVSPISPPMKYNITGLELPSVSHESQSGVGLMGHTTVISHIGDDSPVHYSNLDALTTSSSNNNDASYINQNNPYHWSSSPSIHSTLTAVYTSNELSPLNLRHKPSTVIENKQQQQQQHDENQHHHHQHQHNQHAAHQQQHHDYYEMGNHISTDSTAVMKSFLTNGYTLDESIGESDPCSGVSISSVPTDQHLGLHPDESQHFLTLTTATILQQNTNKGDESPYHTNNNNLHHHSTSSDSRSPSGFDTYDSGLSLTTLNSISNRGNMYASSPVHGSTDHPTVIHNIYDSMQSR